MTQQPSPDARAGVPTDADAKTPELTVIPLDQAMAAPGSTRTARLMAKAVRTEASGWRSLARWITRRPRVAAGATAFRYDSTFRGALIAFTVVCAVETVVVDLIVHRWPLVRFPLLILGIWGALFMLGMLASYLTRPHGVGPDGVQVRHGGDLDLELSWGVIHSVTHRVQRYPQAKTLSVCGAPDRRCLLQIVEEKTNIVLVLHQPETFAVAGGRLTLTTVQFYVDEPRAFMTAARAGLASYESAAPAGSAGPGTD